MGRLSVAVIIGLSIAAAGCAPTTTTRGPQGWERVPTTARVVLMTPDVELAELTAGGVLEPNAEWTEKGKQFIVEALQTQIGARNARVAPYKLPSDAPLRQHDHQQLIKLHQAVGGAILAHHYGPLKLPTKEGRFGWTLGQGVNVLREDADADYALFLFVRDSYASAGRKAAMVAVTVLSLGHAVMGGGVHIAFASLVDLRSGEIVWFNRLVDPNADVREAGPASAVVKKLLEDFPL